MDGNITVNPEVFNSIHNGSDNNMNMNLSQGILRHPLYLIIIYSLAYMTIFICAVVGNSMVVAVVVRNQGMHNVINYFIVNLAIADIMVALICLPMTLLSNIYFDWHFGWFMCKATPYLQGVSVCASVNTLVAIAVDRYLAICFTMGKKISKKTCKVIIICIWIFAFAVMIPWAMYYETGIYPMATHSVVLCYENWPAESDQKWFFLGALFLCCYSVPLVLIVACYLLIGMKVTRRKAPGVKNTSMDVVHKSKVKAVKMLIIVVVLFAFSWLPLYVIKLKTLFYGPSADTDMQKILGDIINPIAQWLGSSNSGMNPILYCLLSKRYRRGFKDALTSCCRGNDSRLQRRALTASYAPHAYVNGHSHIKKTRDAVAYNEAQNKPSSNQTTNTFV